VTLTEFGFVVSGYGYRWRLFDQVSIATVLVIGCVPVICYEIWSIYIQPHYKSKKSSILYQEE